LLDSPRLCGLVLFTGIFAETYVPTKYAWECFVLVRRLVVAAVLLAPSLVNDQAERFTYLVSLLRSIQRFCLTACRACGVI
jgi:hypothetical protein